MGVGAGVASGTDLQGNNTVEVLDRDASTGVTVKGEASEKFHV